MLLEVNDLSISYGKGNPVVHGVSFAVDKGKILAIIGESGSGKTTVLRAVGHILPRQGQVTGGHILFEGKESETKTIREKTSFIFQDSGAMLNPIRIPRCPRHHGRRSGRPHDESPFAGAPS